MLPFIVTPALAACASVYRETPSAMIAEPGATASVTTSMPYDAAYRKTFEQMKSCFEMGGAFLTHFSVYGDKSDKDGVISSAFSGITGHRVLTTVRLKPETTGTKVEIFSASDSLGTDVKTRIHYWLNRNGSECTPPLES